MRVIAVWMRVVNGGAGDGDQVQVHAEYRRM